MTYHSKAIFIDTREKKKEVERIEPQLNALGYETIHNKLWVGDYQLIHNTSVVVDRKKDLQELIGNVTVQHERFKDECKRAQQHGIKLIILCEDGSVSCLDDLEQWGNPRLRIYRYDKEKRRKVQLFPKATTGHTLKKILLRMNSNYNVEFVFCKKEETPKKIIDILEGSIGEFYGKE